MRNYSLLAFWVVSLALAADAYDLKSLVEPITFSCELRDVRLTRVIDRMSSGESSVTRETNSSSDRRTDSSGTRSTTESATVNTSSTHNEDGHRSRTKFDAGGGVKWGLIPYGKVGGEYSNDEFDELRRSTDKTVSNKRGNSTTNTTANERITAEGQDTTSEITNESRLGSYMLVFSIALRNMDATDRLKVDGAHMRAQLSSGDLPGTITAQYKDRGEFWLGAEETICEFRYLVEDAKMLKALQCLERNGKLGQLNLSRSGADIVVISEKTGRNVLSDLNAAEAHRPGTRFSIEFGELMTLPDWRVSRRHSAKSGTRGKRVSIHEALLAIQSVVIETSEVLPSEVFTFADDGSLTNVVDRPLLDTDGEGLFRMLALRLTKNNGATELSLPNAEIMKGEIANYAKVALFSFDLEEFVNVSFENPEYFSGLKNEVEKYLSGRSDKRAYDVYRGFLEKRVHEEDARPLPEDITMISDTELQRYVKRAYAGTPEMQVTLARRLATNLCEVANDKKVVATARGLIAAELFLKAAEHGNAEGEFWVGRCYLEGYGFATNEIEAVKWFRKAALHGNAGGKSYLGWCYMVGKGVAKNEMYGFKWVHEAATQGWLDAVFWVGYAYFFGLFGVEADEIEAVKWFRRGVDKGHAVCQAWLGRCYLEGHGVAKDDFEAVDLFLKAAEQGVSIGQVWLGLCYLEGRGVNKDKIEGMKWLRMAAEKGDAFGQAALGYVYLEGIGVNKDKFEGMKWLRMAAKQGFEPAIDVLKLRCADN